MSSNASYDLLSSLLPTTSYALAYALPLFLVSLLLTFAGAFLTLDRTRIFASNAAPAKQVTPKSKHAWLPSAPWTLFLHGGLGGLCSGYAFGVHFTTFLSLLIPSTTSSSDLSSKSFFAIWVISVVTCMGIAGRWKYATVAFAGMTGFATAALSISVITHPSLITRIVLLAVFATVGTILCLLPFPRVGHVAIRIACASTGSFGVVLCIGIMKRDASWGDVWERMWVHDGSDWGTSQEKALSAAYCLLLCAGLACDTFLHRKFGENPDEKWDRYLAKYTDNLPNDSSRAGTFTPFTSLYDRILGRDHDFAPIVPDQKIPVAQVDIPYEKPRDMFDSHQEQELSVPLNGMKIQPGFLRKKGTTRVKGARLGRRAIRFQPGDEESLTSSDDEDYDLKLKKQHFPPRSLSSASTATLTNSRVREEQEVLKLPSRKMADIPDYSDYEEDLGQAKVSRESPNWTPEFIRRHSTRSSMSRVEHSALAGHHPSPTPTSNPQPLYKASEASRQASPVALSPELMSSVPATPSLIRAVDRITAAYTAQDSSSTPGADGLPTRGPNSPLRRQSWDSFWADVKAKAQT